MSENIDRNVVEMRFDNENFEKNAQTTLRTLDQLNGKLNFDNLTKGLTDVGTAASNIDMSGLSDGVESIADRFSALGIIGMTVLQNITTMALNAGEALVKAIVIDPIKTGLTEYNTQIGSTQTILNNVKKDGYALKDVNAVLDEMNEYADKTIYNFTQMTSYLGKFTVAGVDLKKSATAIEGIANAAAYAGANADQASSAMYMLSQALNQGKMQLYQWRSLELSSIGNQELQKQLINTAKAYGVNVDAMIEKNGSFRETLREGWATDEIILATLAKYTEKGANEYLSELTGLPVEKFQQIRTEASKTATHVEDMDDAFKEFAKTIAKDDTALEEEIADILILSQTAEVSATEVKTLKELYGVMQEAAQSTWTKSWQYIIGDYEEAKTFLTQLQYNMTDLIQSTGDWRNSILKVWHENGGYEALKSSIFDLVSAYAGLKKAFSIGFSNVFHTDAESVGNALIKISKAISSVISKISDFINSPAGQGKLIRIFQGIASAIDLVLRPIKMLLTIGAKIVSVLFPALASSGIGILGLVSRLFIAVDGFIQKIQIFEVVTEAVSTAIDIVAEALKGMYKTAKTYLTKVGDVFKTVGNNIKGFFSGFSDASEAITENIKGVTTAGAVGTAAGGGLIVLFKTIWSLLDDIGDKMEMFKTIMNGFKTVKGTFESLSKLQDFLGWSQEKLKTSIIKDLAKSLALLGAAMLLISSVPAENLSANFAIITGLMGELLGTILVVNRLQTADLTGIKSAVQLKILTGAFTSIAKSVLFMAAAMKMVAEIDKDMLWRSFLVISALFIIVSGCLAGLSLIDPKRSVKGAGTVVALASAVFIMALAMKMISKIPLDAMLAAGGVLGGLITIISGLVYLLSSSDIAGMKAAAKNIRSLSISLILIAAALKIVSTINTGSLIASTVALVVLLGAMTAVMYIISSMKKVSTKGISALLSMAAAMIVMASALKLVVNCIIELASLDLDTNKLWTALGIVVSVIAALTAAAAILSNFGTKALLGATSFIVMAAAIKMVAEVFNELTTIVSGSGNWKEAAAILAGTIAILVVAAAALSNSTAGVLAGAAAMVLMAASLRMIAGVFKEMEALDMEQLKSNALILGIILAALAGSVLLLSMVQAPVMAVASAFGILILSIAALSAGFFLLMQAIIMFSSISQDRIKAFTNNAKLLLTSFKELIPMVINTLVDTIVSFVTNLANRITDILAAVRQVILAILGLLIELSPKIAATIMTLLLTILTTIDAAMPEIMDKGTSIVVKFIQGISNGLPKIIAAAFELIINLINGLADAIDTYYPQLEEAIVNLGTKAWDAMKSVGEDLINGLWKGIKEKWDMIKDKVTEIGTKIVNVFRKTQEVESPSKVWASIGGYMMQGLANGLDDGYSTVESTIKSTGGDIRDAISSALDKANDLLSDDMDINPVITPILDLSQVGKDAGLINDIFNSDRTLGMAYGISRSMGGSSAPIVGSSNKTNNTYATNNNTFNIQSSDPEGVAEEVSKILNKQVERAGAVWA